MKTSSIAEIEKNNKLDESQRREILETEEYLQNNKIMDLFNVK